MIHKFNHFQAAYFRYAIRSTRSWGFLRAVDTIFVSTMYYIRIKKIIHKSVIDLIEIGFQGYLS